MIVEIKRYEKKYKDGIKDLAKYVNEIEYGRESVSRPEFDYIDEYYFQKGGFFWIAVDNKDNVVGTFAFENKNNGIALLRRAMVHTKFREKYKGLAPC